MGKRIASAVVSIALLTGAGVVLPFTQATAADFTVSDPAELQAALADCSAAPNTIELAADIEVYGTNLQVNCDTTLNLSDFELYGSHLAIAPGRSLDVNGVNGSGYSDSGVLHMNSNDGAGIRNTGATLRVHSGRVLGNGGPSAAGIGGNHATDNSPIDGGTLIVNGGTVSASSSQYGYGAAIGGGTRFDTPGYTGGDGGTVIVNGGSLTVTAQSEYGVGIGGGGSGSAGGGGAGATVTVTGGTLSVATTGARSTAVGGGAVVSGIGVPGAGGTLTVGEGATASIGSELTAFGGGWNGVSGAVEGEFGTITVAGVLSLTGGALLVKDDGSAANEITVTATGKLLGRDLAPAVGSSITGDGQVLNQGVIALHPPAAIVSGNNRVLTFTPSQPDVRVFAPSLAEGYRALPSAPAGKAWNTVADGSGAWFTADSSTTGSGTTALFASSPGSLIVDTDPDELTAVSGEAFTYPVTVLDRAGDPLVPQPVVTYTSSDCTLPANRVFSAAGECTVTAAVTIHGVALTETFTVSVAAGAPAVVALNTSASTVKRGDTIVFSVTGTDAAGNPVDTSGVVLTSSVSTDVVDGLSVTFPTASPHVITATLGAATASFLVEVTPTAAGTTSPSNSTLPSTGVHPGLAGAAVAGMVLLLLGAALVIRKRSLRS